MFTFLHLLKYTLALTGEITPKGNDKLRLATLREGKVYFANLDIIKDEKEMELIEYDEQKQVFKIQGKELCIDEKNVPYRVMLCENGVNNTKWNLHAENGYWKFQTKDLCLTLGKADKPGQHNVYAMPCNTDKYPQLFTYEKGTNNMYSEFELGGPYSSGGLPELRQHLRHSSAPTKVIITVMSEETGPVKYATSIGEMRALFQFGHGDSRLDHNTIVDLTKQYYLPVESN
ncbi:hypothetical protein NAPIS_ORF01009 [Vairimorpha apis BRL 01]|uniref:Uncharacterized protein n=1 Tax=Vairimorpha apis BRL 01 TaxID=1037528 RepID=T0MK57_9MICR|nr:hypothetical protein NAPIS_ORF01009 [Vairimorpha apis BRL 01]